MATTRDEEIGELVETLEQLQGQLPEEQHQVIAQVIALLSTLGAENTDLKERVRWFAGQAYRKKGEKVASGQLALELLEMMTAGRVRAEEPDAPEPEPASAAPRKPRPRRARDLPVRITDCRLPEDERECDACGQVEGEIGFDAQQRFIYEPPQVYIREERRYKYACRCGQSSVDTAPPTLPSKPIPGSMASSSVLSQIVVAKILDGTPIERIAKQFRRLGIDLPTSTMNNWFGYAAELLAPLHAELKKRLLACTLISLDDTPLKMQNRAHLRNIQVGRQWIYLGDIDQVAYAEFTENWQGIHPRSVLEGFSGDIQNDGYAGINPLFGIHGGPKRVGCNDHCRRKFVQALERGDSRAQPVLDLYSVLYRAERDAKAAGLDPPGRTARRQSLSLPLWNQLADLIAELAVRVEKKSPLGKAITYWNRQQPHLRAFLDDGRLPISNAHVERQIRTVALFRKNSLFVGSLEAGQRFAVLLSLLLECTLAGVNPYDYLVDVIDKLADGWLASRIGELLPRAWHADRSPEQQPDGRAVAVDAA